MVKSISSFDFTCLLPQEEYLSQKKPRKKSFLIKYRQQQINPNCIVQNQIRKELGKILPKEMKAVEDSEYGVDYYYSGVSFDQKFCFGDLGKDTIKIRVRRKELLNKSDWTMVINENREIFFFKTKNLKMFVKRNWSLVQKNFLEQKMRYSEHYVRLRDFYRIEEVKLIRGEMQNELLSIAMNRVLREHEKDILEDTINADRTVVDYSKRVCFEPSIAKIAKNFFV